MLSEDDLAAQNEHEPTNKPKSTQKKVVRPWLIFLGIAVLSCFGGVFSAFLLTATPLQKGKSSHLPNSHDITSMMSATIDRPVNILVLGIDNSGHPHKNKFTPVEALAGNSDTMLLVRLIPQTHQVNILSIPRDTQVQIPGIGIKKINDANVIGGAQTAAQTVSHLLGNVPIDRYMRLDTEGFIQLVDAIGGVEVTVPKKMDYVDHTQKLEIHFTAGSQKLNGQHLQEYIRFRHDELGDIGRVQRQQQVLKAIIGTLLQPTTIGHLPELLQVVKNNVDTDVSVGEMLALTQLLTHIDRQHVNMVMLPGRFSTKQEFHLSYWIENPQAVATIMAQYFDIHSGGANTLPQTKLPFKQIKLAVLNPTDSSARTSKTFALLRKQGFENIYLSKHEIDIATPQGVTQIIAQQGNTEAAKAVKQALGVGQIQVAATGDIWSDVTVIVGADLNNQPQKRDEAH
jgi:polyisoprenyl-teichoic acid--peptidoglycan teichoic acid transferase